MCIRDIDVCLYLRSEWSCMCIRDIDVCVLEVSMCVY